MRAGRFPTCTFWQKRFTLALLALAAILFIGLALTTPALAQSSALSASSTAQYYLPLLMSGWFSPANFWNAAEPIDVNSAGEQLWPRVGADAIGNAYVVWLDRRESRQGDIYFAYRPRAGVWTAPVRVNDDASDASQNFPDIAVDAAGNAWAIWMDNRNGRSDMAIYAAYRPAAGVWGPNERVSDVVTKSVAYFPAIEMDGAGVPYAIWQDYRNGTTVDIYFSRRTPGVGWSANQIVNDVAGAVGPRDFIESSWPALSVDAAGNAYALWRDFRNSSSEPDIYSSYRPAGGAWQANAKVNLGLPRYWQSTPSVALGSDGCAHAVWRYGQRRIYASDRCPGGDWQPAVETTDAVTRNNANHPLIVVTPANTQFALWEDDRRTRDGMVHLYFDWRSTAGRWHADAPVLPETTQDMESHPDLAVDGRGCLYAVWRNNMQLHFTHTCQP